MKQDVNRASRFSWPLFWILFGAASLSAIAILPMAIDLVRKVLDETPPPPLPLPLLILIGAVQNLVLLALFVGLGLKVGGKLDLGPKLIEAWLAGSLNKSDVWSTLRWGLLGGAGVGAVLLPSILFLASWLPDMPFVSAAKIALWKRILACFYGGIYEEILARLFLLSLFAWLINRSWRRAVLSSPAFWCANVIVAVLFGLGHLPSVSVVMEITPLVIVAALLLNGVAALAFGWLYRKHNLEAAMLAHFTADFILYGLGPYFVMS